MRHFCANVRHFCAIVRQIIIYIDKKEKHKQKQCTKCGKGMRSDNIKRHETKCNGINNGEDTQD